MPHLRPRYLFKNVKSDLSWSPTVSVLGMRQIGKTTLLRQMGCEYKTLDDDAFLRKLEQGQWEDIESAKSPLIIDEAQKCPGLFDRIKLIVDRRRKPGQFLLTGSVRFLSRKQIRESLSGRTSILELLALTLAESHSKSLFDFVGEAARLAPAVFLKKLASQEHFRKKDAEEYMDLGGMPGICFKRDHQVRGRMHESHLETLLMRDLQFLLKTRVPYVKLKALLSMLAQDQGQMISLSDMARRAQLSTPTVIQIIRAFGDLFLVRSHGKNWFLTDCGIANYLTRGGETPLLRMEHFVYQELYAQLNYLHKASFTFGPYATRGGIRIPFVIELKNAPDLAIIVDPSKGASEKSLKSLTWFSKKRRGAVVSIVLHGGAEPYLASNGSVCVPYEWIA